MAKSVCCPSPMHPALPAPILSPRMPCAPSARTSSKRENPASCFISNTTQMGARQRSYSTLAAQQESLFSGNSDHGQTKKSEQEVPRRRREVINPEFRYGRSQQHASQNQADDP